MIHRFILCVFAATSVTAVAEGQPPLCELLRREMVSRHIPVVAVAQFQNWSTESFYCNTAGNEVGPDSVFEAASLSKPVFAYAVLKLVNAKKLDLDRPLVSYLKQPYLHEQNPFAPSVQDEVTDLRLKKVTARMVLTHFSGLPNWARNKKLGFIDEPGSQWHYSGEAYVFLCRVIEEITGQPIREFIQSAVLRPLGMNHSDFVWHDDYGLLAVPGHQGNGSAVPIDHFSRAVVSTTLYTTLGDYSRFLSAQLHPDYDSPAWLQQHEWTIMRPALQMGWGLGVAVEKADEFAIFHWGANPGFQSYFMIQPTTGRGVLFLTNSDNGLDLLDQIVELTVPGKHPSLAFPMLHPKD